MRVFFNAFIIQIILSAYVLWRGWNTLPKKKVVRLPFATIFVIELLIYFTGYFFSKKLEIPYIYYVAWVGTTWMIFILYMSALLLSYDFIRFVDEKKNILPQNLKLSRSKERGIFYCFSLILVIGVMLWGNYRFKNPVVTEMSIELKKESAIDRLRVVMVSDLHAGYLIKKDIIAMYVDKIMEQKPDVILLAGDIIDYDIFSVQKQYMEEEFKRLKAPYGVYATTGNHEYIGIEGEKFHEKITWLSEYAEMTVLRDTTVLVANAFYLVGREDDTYMYRKQLSELMKDVDKSYPVILMNHQPHHINEGAENGADIAFYGHTHNGQFFPNNLAAKFIWDLPHGYKQIDDTHVYVSSGLGLAGPQFRIGTISEIVVFDLKFNK